jgi:hypothetical protein
MLIENFTEPAYNLVLRKWVDINPGKDTLYGKGCKG